MPGDERLSTESEIIPDQMFPARNGPTRFSGFLHMSAGSGSKLFSLDRDRS
jgi:hypothetical protein